MKSPYVTDLKPDQMITGSFLVCSKEIRQKKKGDPYLSLQLGDRTGELDGKMFDNAAEFMDTFSRDDFVKVKGLLQIFHNRMQLTIHTIHRLDDREVDFTDYFPASTRDPDEMWRELRGFAAGIENPHLNRLVAALLDDEDVARRYRIAPAAKHIHHAYLGGLIEHVLSVCHLARMTAGHYAFIDGDLLTAGVILHDIGKVYELSYERGFGYTDEGQLLGHMLIAVRMIADKLRAIPDFPPRLRVLVEHMVISHHGQLEFGSPKRPVFAEAMLLHYLDDLDSKMECMRHLLETDRQFAGNFTSFSASLDRVLLKKENYLAAPASEPPSQPAAPSKASSATAPKTSSPFGDKLLRALQPADES
ncbi:MAG TPA: HD domain-containing protein [Bryobacteraceae bacterium]|nr:HD domain-containing protein [Bryobacteraceae bacterium]